jgi:hypothetical protein
VLCVFFVLCCVLLLLLYIAVCLFPIFAQFYRPLLPKHAQTLKIGIFMLNR